MLNKWVKIYFYIYVGILCFLNIQAAEMGLYTYSFKDLPGEIKRHIATYTSSGQLWEIPHNAYKSISSLIERFQKIITNELELMRLDKNIEKELKPSVHSFATTRTISKALERICRTIQLDEKALKDSDNETYALVYSNIQALIKNQIPAEQITLPSWKSFSRMPVLFLWPLLKAPVYKKTLQEYVTKMQNGEKTSSIGHVLAYITFLLAQYKQHDAIQINLLIDKENYAIGNFELPHPSRESIIKNLSSNGNKTTASKRYIIKKSELAQVLDRLLSLNCFTYEMQAFLFETALVNRAPSIARIIIDHGYVLPQEIIPNTTRLYVINRIINDISETANKIKLNHYAVLLQDLIAQDPEWYNQQAVSEAGYPNLKAYLENIILKIESLPDTTSKH